MRIPPVYLWKTDLSASTVTEVGPTAMAALRASAESVGTLLTLVTPTDEVIWEALQVPSLAV